MQRAYESEDYIEIAKKWRIFKRTKESKYKIEETNANKIPKVNISWYYRFLKQTDRNKTEYVVKIIRSEEF